VAARGSYPDLCFAGPVFGVADNRILDLTAAVAAFLIVSADADLTSMSPWRGRPADCAHKPRGRRFKFCPATM